MGVTLVESGLVAATLRCVTPGVVGPTKCVITARVGTLEWLEAGVCCVVFA